MKYIKSFVVVFVVILLLTGCGNSSDTLKCTIEEGYEDKKIETEVTATFKDGVVEKVSAELTFDSENTATSYYNIVINYQKFLNDGENLIINLDKKKMTIDNFQYMLEQETNSENEEKIEVVGLTKDEYKTFMKNRQYSCDK